jgi:hypothetical protein
MMLEWQNVQKVVYLDKIFSLTKEIECFIKNILMQLEK